jgi:class 3 adenylate cyclase
LAQEGFKRRLKTILSTDAIGYSRLMQDDGEDIARDFAVRCVMNTEIIQQHHGRVGDSSGDNMPVEFAGAGDAGNDVVPTLPNKEKRVSDFSSVENLET